MEMSEFSRENRIPFPAALREVYLEEQACAMRMFSGLRPPFRLAAASHISLLVVKLVF